MSERAVFVLQRTGVGVPEQVEETTGADLGGFAGDAAIEIGRLMEDTDVQLVRVTLEWEGTY